MSTPKTITPKAKNDVQYQEVKLFIEGIQVPFLSISINSSLSQLPQASISLPPQTGLVEITRFYNPKIHIFFRDPIDSEEKLLFSGIALSSSSSRTADGSSSVSFNCVHRNQLMTDVLLDYTGWTSQAENVQQSNEGAFKSVNLSSKISVGMALTGVLVDSEDIGSKLEVTKENVEADIKGKTTKVSTAVIPSFLTDFKNRVIGMPGVLVNLWNQVKFGAYAIKDNNDITLKLHIPLVEKGLQFFQRMAGHFFIEEIIDEDRIVPCATKGAPESTNQDRIVPPACRVFLRSAAQSTFAEEQIFSGIQFSGELVDILSLFQKYLQSIDYEFLFLNAPAEVVKDPTMDDSGNFTGDPTKTYGVDTIIKPQLPFYFSPVCNILYPSMIMNLNVSQDDYGIPTRVTFKNMLPLLNGNIVNQFFRGPPSIREAIASATSTETKTVLPGKDIKTIKTGTREEVTTGMEPGTKAKTPRGNLLSTLNSSHGKIGKFEQGRGIRAEKRDFPLWLKFLSKSQDIGGIGQKEVASDQDIAGINAMREGWKRRYGVEVDALNPWDETSGLQAYQKLLVASADYYYAMNVVKARAGSADCIFNPYIVPGYPMDILDSTPNHPSYHAYCTSVTHVITSSGINTSISFVSAMTYTELANYYMLPVHPWLLHILGLAESQSIVDYEAPSDSSTPATPVAFSEDDPLDPSAAGIADRFYKTTLGVGAAQPTMLYSFNTGLVNPVERQNIGLVPGVSGPSSSLGRGELNPNLSGIGNLALNYRNIESRAKVEERWGIKFIDLKPGNYNKNVIKIDSKVLADKNKLELGQSIWLKYDI